MRAIHEIISQAGANLNVIDDHRQTNNPATRRRTPAVTVKRRTKTT